MTAFRKFLIQTSSRTALGFFPLLVGTLVALGVIVLILNHEHVEPRAVYDLIYERTLSLPENRANVVDFWLPILLCCCGLLLTFTAGLWNIGIEGQITMGAVGATSIALFVKLPHNQQILTELFMAGAAGGAWALFTGIMRTRGGVNEIFGGVAMNFLASNFSTYLLVGPWSPPNATGSATVRFPDYSLLPSMDKYRLSPITIYITLTAFIFVLLTLSGSRWGLQLRAMGKNQKSAQMLGVPTERNIWLAMLMCGIMAGLAGGHLVLFRRSNLPANVSGGIGFLSLLVVLLASVRVRWVPIVSFAFALLYSAGLPLRTRLQLDSSLVGIFLGILVFCVLIFDGVRQRLQERIEQRKLLAASGGEKSPPPPTIEIQIGEEVSSGSSSN
ncbi:MAG: ABC transporter permease [Chloroflexi bacterium]|nr:ABC transporter permease [Chloroflexota bacterium]